MPRRKYDENVIYRCARLYRDGAKIKEIAKELNIPRQSVSMLLEKAKRKGILRITAFQPHVVPLYPELHYPGLEERIKRAFNLKEKIAQYVSNHIAPYGDKVAIGVGSTCLLVLKNLSHKGALYVVTTNLAGINLLINHPDCYLFVIGGQVDKGLGKVVLKEFSLEELEHLLKTSGWKKEGDKLFKTSIMSVRAVYSTGAILCEAELWFRRAMIESSYRVFFIADSMKLKQEPGGERLSFKKALEDGVEFWFVTDDEISKDTLDRIKGSLKELKMGVGEKIFNHRFHFVLAKADGEGEEIKL